MSELGGAAIEAATDLVEEHGVAAGLGPPWARSVALATMIMAVLSAIGALLAGMTAHESLMARTEEAIETTRIAEERLEVQLLRGDHRLLEALGQPVPEAERALVAEHDRRAAELVAETREDEAEVRRQSRLHLELSVAVTLLGVAMSLGGVSVVVARKGPWRLAQLLGVAGMAVLAYATWGFARSVLG